MKAVLTVIAGALCVIAGGQLMPGPASALTFEDTCGNKMNNACWVMLTPGAVEIKADYPLPVRVFN